MTARFPTFFAVEALMPYRLRVTFDDGAMMDVDLADKISGIKALEPILDPSVFATAHASKGGSTLDWEGFDSIFGADNVYAWGKEQAGEPSHAMIWEWLHRNKLTQQQAADAIGISRRMLGYYLACAKPVQKTIWLACLGWEAESKRLRRRGRRPTSLTPGKTSSRDRNQQTG